MGECVRKELTSAGLQDLGGGVSSTPFATLGAPILPDTFAL